MKKIGIIILCCFAFVLSAKACLNYYYTLDKEGHLHEAGEGTDLLRPFNTNFNTKLIVGKMLKLQEKMKEEHSYQLLSDYAVALLKLGKTQEALEILVQLEFHYPNEYKIASNLGTAYELSGQVDSALKYIKRGLQLNPKDHEGSEWIHVKILETKQNLAKDSTWLKTHTVLQLSGKQLADVVIRNQILIQVQERFPFCKGPDPIMSSLFVDLGDLNANLNSIEYAKAFYNIAKEYYGDKSKLVSDKIKEMQKLSDKFSSVAPPELTYKEGDNVKLGTFSYKTLLGDNDPDHYKIDWSKINTDVKSLLAEANLTYIVRVVEANGQLDSSDSSQTKEFTEPYSSTEKSSGRNKALLIIIIAVVGCGTIGLLLPRFIKKLKSK